MDDDELERLWEDFCRRCDEEVAERGQEILDRSAEVETVQAGDDQIILFGFEYEVDAVVTTRQRPEMWLRPMARRMTYVEAEDSSFPLSDLAPLPTAKYRRVGPSTYQRER